MAKEKNAKENAEEKRKKKGCQQRHRVELNPLKAEADLRSLWNSEKHTKEQACEVLAKLVDSRHITGKHFEHSALVQDIMVFLKERAEKEGVIQGVRKAFKRCVGALCCWSAASQQQRKPGQDKLLTEDKSSSPEACTQAAKRRQELAAEEPDRPLLCCNKLRGDRACRPDGPPGLLCPLQFARLREWTAVVVRRGEHSGTGLALRVGGGNCGAGDGDCVLSWPGLHNTRPSPDAAAGLLLLLLAVLASGPEVHEVLAFGSRQPGAACARFRGPQEGHRVVCGPHGRDAGRSRGGLAGGLGDLVPSL